MTAPSRAPNWRVAPAMRDRARALRHRLTDAERVVWHGLRAHRLRGIGFRRQKVIGPYIVDFVSHVARLVIEIDGGQHYEAANLVADARRDAYLASKGYRVLRFTNLDVLRNRDGVLEAIADALGAAPSLPSPASGGGGVSGPPSPASGGGLGRGP